MTQYILKRKTEQALRSYEDLIMQGEETIGINTILFSQLHLLLQTKFLVRIDYQQTSIVETLKIYPYRVRLAIQEVKKFDEHLLVQLFNQLAKMDYQIKTGQIEKGLSFQLFVSHTEQLLRNR